MRAGSPRRAQPGEFGVVLGVDLARSLGVLRGDKIALVAPQGGDAGGRDPAAQAVHGGGHLRGRHRRRRLGLALVHMQDAQTLYQLASR